MILHVAMLVNLGSVLTAALLAVRSIHHPAVPFLIAYAAVGVLGLGLLRTGRVRQAALIYCVVVWLCVAGGDVVLAHPQATLVSSFLNVMLLAGFTIAEWAALGFGLASMSWVGITLWLRSLGELPGPAQSPSPVEVLVQTSLPLLYTAILASFGFRSLRRAGERAEASEQEHACLASRHQTLAELGERLLRIESKPVFANQVASDLQRVTGASSVTVYAPGPTALDRIAAVGVDAPASLTRRLPESKGAATGRVHLLAAHDVGIATSGCVAWTGERGYAAVAVLLTHERPLPSHDEVLLAGCTALLAAALSRLDAEEQLRHSQKMETVGQLTGVIAHDFNNLLMSIMGGSELVMRSVRDPDLQNMLGDVIRAGEHAALLTKRLMAFSRRDMLDFRLIDLREFALSSSRLLKRLLEPHLALSMPAPGPPVWVRVDQSSVEQIILNLVLNARDATHGSGKVSVEVDTNPQARAAVLRVTDNGMGMSETVRARIFDPFFTTKPTGKGTGLGLSAVRAAADALGGSIEVSSTIGRGSEFRVILPLAEAEALSAEHATRELARARDRESILLVDDHDVVRRTLAKLLKQAGFEVNVANDGVEALQMLASGVAPSAIVSDILMPRLSGIELARALADQGSRVPIVLLTGYAELQSEDAASLPTKIPILRKPTTAATLTTAVRNAIDAGAGHAASTDKPLEAVSVSPGLPT